MVLSMIMFIQQGKKKVEKKERMSNRMKEQNEKEDRKRIAIGDGRKERKICPIELKGDLKYSD